jgi:tRNA-specific 2-thiouridylase
MSGGVDSSVVAGLLVEQGHEVVGVHMKLHDQPEHPSAALAAGDGKHCCGLDDSWDARRVADTLGIPFYVMDLREAFKRAVIDSFTESWVSGATPNPCVQCNGVLKFQVLLQRARALGASHLATGHYARISPSGGLLTARDLDKDQSYFLFPVQRSALLSTLFPLGGLTKTEVRAHAARLGLTVANKPESQETCFIPDDDHTRFVKEQRPDLQAAGDIVDEQGRVLGRHDGYFRYTVGQRRGLGVAAAAPLYVLRVEPESRRVVVGGEERLRHQGLRAKGFTWHRLPAAGEPVLARLRHRGALLPVEVELEAGSEGAVVDLRFLAPARAATRGQAVVIYSGDEVLGGGWIHSVEALSSAESLGGSASSRPPGLTEPGAPNA